MAQSQANPQITALPTPNSFQLTWPGVAGRLYFIECSTDLQTWTYLPDVQLGSGINLSNGFSCSTGRTYLRLRYSIATNITAGANGDIDGDGISNHDEVATTHTDPFTPEDTDGDGIPDFAELAYTLTDPLVSQDSDNDDVLDAYEPIVSAGCALEMSGDASLGHTITPKHGLRVDFRPRYSGDARSKLRDVKAFRNDWNPTQAKDNFSRLILKSPTNDSWASPAYPLPAPEATYVADTWVRRTHEAMGYPIAHWRWVHLYLNGLYWGVYQLTERIDSDWLDDYVGDGQYDLIKEGVSGGAPVASEGDTTAWNALLAACAAFPSLPAAQQAAAYSAIEAQLDVDNYIDYLLLNCFVHNYDWPHKNFRAARKRVTTNLPTQDGRFKFYVWDAEIALKKGTETADPFLEYATGQGSLNSNIGGPVWNPHLGLKDYQPYRDRWTALINLRLLNNGVLAETNAPNRYIDVAARFAPVVECESARWGDCTAPMAYRADTFTPPGSTTPQSGWNANIARTRDTFLTQRQAKMLNFLRDQNLYPPAP